MPVRALPQTRLRYALICHDARGIERRESDGARLSEEMLRRAVNDDVTDVFLMSHGWKADVPATIEQYDRWVAAMVHSSDGQLMTARRPRGFRPLIIGLHWPSLPWGDERMPAPATAGLLDAHADSRAGVEFEIALYAARISEAPAAVGALRTILQAAEDGGLEALSPALVSAYETLYTESGLSSGDAAAAPGSDHDGWSPREIFDQMRLLTPPHLGLLGAPDGVRDAVLGPLRQLSFWKMKDRARAFGEGAAHELLRRLQVAAPGARFHIMGHSFGCIVASAAVAGARGGRPLLRAIDSLFLVQGALSLWSFCADVPHAPGKAGYFSDIVGSRLVRGPIVTTRSRHDRAIGTLYPLGAEVRRQMLLADALPRYGGLGAFGAQGLADVAVDMNIQAATYDYAFAGGRVYNLDASAVISRGEPPSGAHNDIVHPEVAHAMWGAALGGGDAGAHR